MRRLGVPPNRRRSLSLAAAPGAGRRRASAGDCSGASGREMSVAATVTVHESIRLGLAVAGRPRSRSRSRSAHPRALSRRCQYPATPPTKGALYPDGQDDRWLLGGEWLYQADPGDIGVQDGWWRNVAEHVGLVAGDGPQLLQRGRSERGEHGRVGRLVQARLHVALVGLRALRPGPLPQLDRPL